MDTQTCPGVYEINPGEQWDPERPWARAPAGAGPAALWGRSRLPHALHVPLGRVTEPLCTSASSAVIKGGVMVLCRAQQQNSGKYKQHGRIFLKSKVEKSVQNINIKKTR